MLTLINTNRMAPTVGPIGLDYIAGAAKRAGIEVDIVDLCLADDSLKTLQDYFAKHNPQLVGISFRNVDDCFWPSATWFVPQLAETVRTIKSMTGAPIVLGGVGFSIFARQIVEYTGADFGIQGDGEQAIVALFNELQKARQFERVDGLIWRANGTFRGNRPAWPVPLSLPTSRDAIDNLAYFKKGGQGGIETKRGCNMRCIYCADPVAKGHHVRLRSPQYVVDELKALLAQGIDHFHTCD
ncbi:MAG: cobalamin-dependent protein, partial [Sedimentisphaerales bacterium]|nr:cobalamin-dependent protein [Sedimentisphaerales bacterium]